MYIYLDESGDLGFDFSKPKTTSYFVITILVIESPLTNRKIEKGIERTLKNKVNYGGKKNLALELKGSMTGIEVKKYFYRQIREQPFELYTVAVDKRRVPPSLRRDQERLYNYLARLVIERCPFQKAKPKIILTLDRSKTKRSQKAFDTYLLFQLEGSLPPKIPLEVFHLDSKESKGIQAIDLFSWGIFKKYENKEMEWYNLFKEKLRFEGKEDFSK